MLAFDNINLQIKDSIVTVSINRPSKMNALNYKTIEEIGTVMQQVYDNREIKGVIFTGEGERAFIAGADIAEIAALTEVSSRKFSERGQEIFAMIEDCPKPVIAAINGYALGGSSNIGDACAMFEAIHGSAPTIAGKGIANPSGLLHGAIMMLVHIGQAEVAAKIHNAWLCTIEAGIHTGDIYKEKVSKKKVGTEEFADAIIERLGGTPHLFKTVSYSAAPRPIYSREEAKQTKAKKELVGVDVFLDWDNGTANDLGKSIEQIRTDDLKLSMISNRGARVYPDGLPETFCTDHWRCRYVSEGGKAITHNSIIELLTKIKQAGFDFIQTENLCTFNGKPGYSMGQGE